MDLVVEDGFAEFVQKLHKHLLHTPFPSFLLCVLDGFIANEEQYFLTVLECLSGWQWKCKTTTNVIWNGAKVRVICSEQTEKEI
jgi:hypothetical protein